MSTWNDVGGNPAPGRPGEIRTVANYLGELSVSARIARRQLAALQRGELQACWTGVAADAFAAELDILPADLGKLERSLDHASTAIGRWATVVDNAQNQAERALREHDSAERRLRTARDERAREREAAASDALIDPVSAIGDALTGNNRLAPYDQRVDDAYDQVRRVRNDIEQIRDDVDATARTVARLLEEASRLGIANKGFFEQIGDFLADIGEALIEVLRVLDAILDAIGPFIGLALVIAGVLTLNPAFAVAGLALATADLGVTVARAALGDETVTWGDILDDSIDVGLAALGVAAGYAAAAKGAGALAKGSDVFIDVIAGGKAGGDIGGLLFAGPGEPGSVYELVYDLAGGEGSVLDNPVNPGDGSAVPIGDLPSPDPAPGPMPGPDPAPGPMPGPDPAPGPMPGPDPAPGPMPGPDPAPGPMPGPDPAPGPMPGPDPAPQPAPFPQPDPAPVGGGGDFGGGAPIGDFADGPSDFGNLGGADLAGAPAADRGIDFGSAPAASESATGLVPDAAPGIASTETAATGALAGDLVADSAGSGGGGGPSKGLIAGAAAVAGLAGAAAGAKRIVDDHADDGADEANTSSVWASSPDDSNAGRVVAVVDTEPADETPSDPPSPGDRPGAGSELDAGVIVDPLVTIDPTDLFADARHTEIDNRVDHGQTIALTDAETAVDDAADTDPDPDPDTEPTGRAPVAPAPSTDEPAPEHEASEATNNV